jgi:heterodisulfide reductase subunit C
MTKKEQISIISELSATDARKCMKCGKCSGRCPAFAQMDVKPHEFVSLLVKGKVEKLLESKSIWTCMSCMACVERCPRGVAPASVIEAVRDAVIRKVGANGVKAEEIEVVENMPPQFLVAAYRKYNK